MLNYVLHRMRKPEIDEWRQAAGIDPITAATYLADMKRPPRRAGP